MAWARLGGASFESRNVVGLPFSVPSAFSALLCGFARAMSYFARRSLVERLALGVWSCIAFRKRSLKHAVGGNAFSRGWHLPLVPQGIASRTTKLTETVAECERRKERGSFGAAFGVKSRSIWRRSIGGRILYTE